MCSGLATIDKRFEVHAFRVGVALQRFEAEEKHSSNSANLTGTTMDLVGHDSLEGCISNTQ
jgi:hypothetical protein